MIDTARLFLLLALLAPLGLGVMYGQGGTVVGVVRTDSDRQPVRDARLRLLGTTLSGLSGPDGHYRIVDVPPGEHEAFVVAKGYIPRTLSLVVPPADSVTLDVEVTRAARGANGSATLPTGDHEAITQGAGLAQVDAESLARDAPIETFSELLMARAAGVEVMPSSGTAGTGSQIAMRGVANPYVSIAPLVYVDGVRVDGNLRALTIDVGGQAPSRLDDLDPATLQSVQILRGPAAAALYGAEATNGVILVTTRQGAPGPIRLRAFTAQGFASEAERVPDNIRAVTASGAACPLDAQAQGSCAVQRILRSNPLENGPASPIAAGAVRVYGLEAAGGTGKVRFALGGDVRSDAGIYHLPNVEASRLLATYGTGALRDDVVDPNYLRRTSVYSTTTFTPSPHLEVDAAARYLSSSLRLPLNDNADAGLLANGLLGSPDSTAGGQWWQFRPGEIFQVSSAQAVDRFIGSVRARFRPTAFLEFRGTLGGESLRQHDGQLQRAGEGPSAAGLSTGFVADNWARTRRLTATVSVAAAERLSTKLTGRTTLGAEYWSVNGDTLLQQGSGLPPGGTSLSEAANLSVTRVSSRVSDKGYLLEQEFSHAGRLFVGAALRWDHATGPESSPSAVVDPTAWASWLVPLKGDGALELLRLRWATGSVTRRSPFPLPMLIGSIGGGPPPALPGPPDPERTTESELGVDVQFLHARLGLGATAYGKRTWGFVTFTPTAPSSGFSYQLINGGDIWNQGVELEVTAEPLRSEQATLDVRLDAWGNRSRVARVRAFLVPVGFQQWVFQGYPVGTYYTIPVVSFKDANGDGVLTSSEIRLGDPIASGSPLPTQGASASIGFAWRHWLRWSTTLEHRGGGSQQDLTAASRCQLVVCSARSVAGTPLAEQARALADGLGLEGGPEDNGFVKLREVALTMTAPPTWAARLGATMLRLTLAGRNLATWTPYRGMDPETNAVGQLGVPRLDSFTQPLVRYWTARVDVEF